MNGKVAPNVEIAEREREREWVEWLHSRYLASDIDV